MTAQAVAVVVRGPKLLVVPGPKGGHAVLPAVPVASDASPEQAVRRWLSDEWSLDSTAVRHRFERDHDGETTSYVVVEALDGEPAPSGPQPIWVTAGELSLVGLEPKGIGDLVMEAVWPLCVDEITDAEWPLLERLWQLYQHDLSEFRHSAPDAEGLFNSGRLPAYRDAPDRVGYLARLGDVPCGFALVRLGVRRDRRTMGEFFVTRSARGRGVAAAFARDVIGRHPGPWVIPFQNENPRAAAFWRRLTAEQLVDVEEQLLPVPGKPHLPPDVWLTGTQPVGT